MTDTTAAFQELFWGNTAAIGTEDGGCMRLGGDTQDAFAKFVAAHLRGDTEPVGVYPMCKSGEQWLVKWGCIDFDEGEEESWVHAKNVHLALQTFGVTGWIERSRSKGYHVWVFLDEWTNADLVRRALLAACQIVEAPTKEINPKQSELGVDAQGRLQLGNYVRLPYPGALGDGPMYVGGPGDPMRRVVIYDDGISTVERFVGLALANRTNEDTLEKLASYYKPTSTPLRTRNWDMTEYQGPAADRLRGVAKMIFQDGPIDGERRGKTLYKLGCYLREDGKHTRVEAYDLIRDADLRWGKFYERPDCDKYLNDILDKAGF